MTDFIDGLEHDLVEAARRQAAAQPAGSRRRRRLRPGRGKVLPATTAADDHTRQGRSRPVTQARPARHCVIGSAAGYVAGYARVAVSRPTPAPRLVGRAFASCANTVFHTEPSRGGLNTAILLDAHDPGRRAAPLPRTPGLSSRRLGPGWIVVFGGKAADRRRLLAQLRPRL